MSKVKILIVILPFFLGCIGVEKREGVRLGRISTEPHVRILLGSEGGAIQSNGDVYIHRGDKIYRLPSGKIELRDGKIYKGGQKIYDVTPSIRVTFESKKFRYNGLRYRGEVILTNSLIINVIPIESYLYSVVACEFECGEIEAMKAGACAARTYTLRHLKPDGDYDLLATEGDQVYRGINSETKNSRLACNKTKGFVCIYRGKPIDARYSSTCGGRTADAKDVFGKGEPYLRSRPCNYCKISPHYSWTHKYSIQNFRELTRNRIKMIKGRDPGRIKRVKIKKRDRSRRVKEITVRGENGEFTIDDGDVRKLFDVESRYFDIKSKGNWVYIDGRGWGHGVGMCSWGAIGMAKKGKKFKEILRYYYQGISVKKLY
jgi:stage II sporulation protein D